MKKKIKQYINQLLGDEALVGNFIPLKGLPFYLVGLYDFFQVKLLNENVVLMLAKTNQQTAVKLKKHIQITSKNTKNDIIYVVENIRSHQRKRLIEQKIAFIVPGKQMYLPMTGIDLRENFKQLSKHKESHFSPLAQIVVIQQLLGILPPFTTSAMIHEFSRYSNMTVNRAMHQLTEKKLTEMKSKGREKYLIFVDDKKTLWDRARPWLRSPVKKSVFVNNTFNLDQLQNICIAGETALANNTMLIAPQQAQYAVDHKLWQMLNIEYSEEDNEAPIRLEIWKYNPILLTKNDTVDKYSLYLSLNHINDERVQIALTELMKND